MKSSIDLGVIPIGKEINKLVSRKSKRRNFQFVKNSWKRKGKTYSIPGNFET
jgi:hypothetical protein